MPPTHIHHQVTVPTGEWVAPDLGDLPIGTPGYVDLPLFGLSKGAQRTQRRYAAIDAGIHPLTRKPLHPDAPTDASPTDGYLRPYTCGACAHIVKRPKGYKCGYGDGKRMSDGEATTIFLWLPACTEYEEAPVDSNGGRTPVPKV